jgi:elongation factor Ts
MQVASMGADTLSYKDFDPAFVDSELAAHCYHRKENEEAKRLGKL